MKDKSKTKILQIIPFFVPAWGFGGPVKVCFDLSKRLADNGYEVTVATTDALDQTNRISKLEEEIDGIKIVRFRNLSTIFAKNLNLYMPFGFKKWLGNNIKKFDILHLHAFFTYQNIVSSKLAIKNNIPYILHMHESPIPLPLLGKVSIKKIFNYFWGKNILKNACKIIVVSRDEKEKLNIFMPEIANKIEVVANPIEKNAIVNKNSKQEIREKYGYAEKDKIILSLSRLSYIKGFDFLLKTFALLVKKDKNYKLIIAGPDQNNQKSKLLKLTRELNIEENVKFLDFVEGQKKEDLFLMSDIFALFSLYESFSVVTLEAISYGLPCCLSDKIAIAGELKDMGSAELVDINDFSESAKKLEYVYDNREKMMKNCKKSLDNFSPRKSYGKITDIYDEINKTEKLKN